jgi:hypothetical protein
LPLQQQMEMTQNREDAMLNATASQSNAITLVPTVLVIWYCLKAVFMAPTTVEKRTVEVTAARMVNKVAAWH